MTQAGQYNRQFTWLVRSYSTDAYGNQVPSWSGSNVLWGSLVESSGTSGEQDGGNRSRTNPTITLNDQVPDRIRKRPLTGRSFLKYLCD